jgi:hypothetical protein
MNKDKKYYVFSIDSKTAGSFPIWIKDKDNEDYDGYYSHEELLSIELKIFNQIKEENIYNDICDIYKSITVTQYDNEKDASSHIAYIENFHKTYSIRKLLKNINKD